MMNSANPYNPCFNLTIFSKILSRFFPFSLPHSNESASSEPPSDDSDLPAEFSCESAWSPSGRCSDTTTNSEEDLLDKLEGRVIIEIEEAALCLQKITESREDARDFMCHDRLLSALRPLIISAYSSIQASSLAVLVNLSTENANRVKMVQPGIIPNLTFLLETRSLDVQELAARALSNLSMHDGNKLMIGLLGTLPRLVETLHSKSEKAARDSAMALYHLSLLESNCTKLIQADSVYVIMDLLRSSRHLVETLLLVVCNLGSCPEGQTALLDSGAVRHLLGLLDRGDLKSEWEWFNCLNALLARSKEGDRFRLLAKAYKADKILSKVKMEGPRSVARSLINIIYSR